MDLLRNRAKLLGRVYREDSDSDSGTGGDGYSSLTPAQTAAMVASLTANGYNTNPAAGVSPSSSSSSSSGPLSGDAWSNASATTMGVPNQGPQPSTSTDYSENYGFGYGSGSNVYGGWTNGPLSGNAFSNTQSNSAPLAEKQVQSDVKDESLFDRATKKTGLLGISIEGQARSQQDSDAAAAAKMGMSLSQYRDVAYGPGEAPAYIGAGNIKDLNLPTWNVKDSNGNPVLTGEAAQKLQSMGLHTSTDGNLLKNTTAGTYGDYSQYSLGDLKSMDPNTPIGYNQTAQQAINADNVGKFVEKAGNLAISMVASKMGLSPLLTAVKAYAAWENSQKTDKPMSAEQAIKSVLFDIGGGLVAGKVNSAVAKAVGPEVSGAMNAYNQFGALANFVSPGSAPSINVGSRVVDYAKDALGVQSANPPSGMTTPAGEPVTSYGGWSSGGSSGPGPVSLAPTATSPVAKVAGGGVIDGTFGQIDLGLIGRNIRRKK